MIAHTVRRSRGFTLIELLLSIAIIAVLVSLLVPAARKFTQAGKGAKCANNLRQISVAVNSYASDNDGKYPLPLSHGSSSRFIPVRYLVNGVSQSGSADENKALDPYISDLRVTMCPVVVEKKMLGPTELQYWMGTQSVVSEKAYLKREKVDANDPYPALAWCTWPAYDFLKTKGGPPHGGQSSMNVLYLDGSVRSVGYKEWRSGGYP